MNGIKYLSKQDKYRLVKLYYWLINDPVIALWILTGIRLAPHQRIILRAVWRVLRGESKISDILIVIGRAGGKSFLSFIIAILSAWLLKENIAYLNATGFKLGKSIFENGIKVLNKKRDFPREFFKFSLQNPQKPIRKDPSVWDITFKHGATIFTTPLGEKGVRIRGFRATAVIVDERAKISEQIKKAAIDPLMYVTKDPTEFKAHEREFNIRIDVGTVDFADTDFNKKIIKAEEEISRGDVNTLLLKFDFEDGIVFFERGYNVYKWYEDGLPPHKAKVYYRFDFRSIIKDLTDPTVEKAIVLAEVKNIAIMTGGSAFPHNITKPSFEFTFNGEPYYLEYTTEDPVVIGIDPARESNFFAFTVIKYDKKLNKFPVIWGERYRFITAKEADRILWNLLKRYPNTVKIAVDIGGGGTAFRDELMKSEEHPDTVIYDPDDKDPTVQQVVSEAVAEGKEMLPLLRLVRPRPDYYAMVGGFTKNAMKSTTIVFPTLNKSMYSVSGELEVEYDKARKVLLSLQFQITNIKEERVANGIKYIMTRTESSASGDIVSRTKDQFTSFLYAIGEIREMYFTQKDEEEQIDWDKLMEWF